MNFTKVGFYTIDGLTSELCQGSVYKRYGKGLTYFNMKDPRTLSGMAAMFKPDGVKWVEALGTLRPHRDHGVSTVMNVYAEPSGYATTFYDVKDGQKPYLFPGETVASVYAPEQLDVMDSFVAEAGDVWLLDVTKVHAVTGGRGTRKFVQFSWSTKTIEEVLARS